MRFFFLFHCLGMGLCETFSCSTLACLLILLRVIVHGTGFYKEIFTMYFKHVSPMHPALRIFIPLPSYPTKSFDFSPFIALDHLISTFMIHTHVVPCAYIKSRMLIAFGEHYHSMGRRTKSLRYHERGKAFYNLNIYISHFWFKQLTVGLACSVH